MNFHMHEIAIIGAGTMGRGIAYAAALGEYRTVLQDVSAEALDRAFEWIGKSFEEGVTRGKVEPHVRVAALAKISRASSVEDACRNADLIIEAAPEDIRMKMELF